MSSIYKDLENEGWSIQSNLSGWHTLRLDGAKVLMADTFEACTDRIKTVEGLGEDAIIAYDTVQDGVMYPTSYFKKEL